MKNKKFLGLLFCMIFLASLLSCFASSDDFIIEVDNLNFMERLMSSQTYYITGGSILDGDVESVMKGELIDYKFNTRFSDDADEYRLDIWWQNVVSGEKILLGQRTFSYPHEEGDWIQVNIRNLDTNTINDDWCFQQVTVLGFHYNLIDNVWVVDTDPLGEETVDVLGFRLECDATNPCESSFIRRECWDDYTVSEIWESVYQDANGDCQEQQILSHCSDIEQCVDGECVQVEGGYDDGDTRCWGSWLQEFDGERWDYNYDCENCVNDECIKWVGQDSVSNPGIELSSCTEDKYKICADGSKILFMKCIDGFLEPTNSFCDEDESVVCVHDLEKTCDDETIIVVGKCVDGVLERTNQACDAEECNFFEVYSVEDNECEFFFSYFGNNYQTETIVVSILLGLVILLIFVIFKQGRG